MMTRGTPIHGTLHKTTIIPFPQSLAPVILCCRWLHCRQPQLISFHFGQGFLTDMNHVLVLLKAFPGCTMKPVVSRSNQENQLPTLPVSGQQEPNTVELLASIKATWLRCIKMPNRSKENWGTRSHQFTYLPDSQPLRPACGSCRTRYRWHCGTRSPT